MAEVLKAFLDMKNDVKNLITVLRELNNHLGQLEKSIKVVEEVSKTFQKNEANLKRLIDEMEKTNKNIGMILEVLKEVK
jgi:ABC-type transporter Mla subunit MlaD